MKTGFDGQPFYINKKGNRVYLEPTTHALKRFWDRLRLIHPDQNRDHEVDITIKLGKSFASSVRKTNLGHHLKRRLKNHAKDTLYFFNTDFTFVVQNTRIVTVEICIKEKRILNKVSGVYKV